MFFRLDIAQDPPCCCCLVDTTCTRLCTVLPGSCMVCGQSSKIDRTAPAPSFRPFAQEAVLGVEKSQPSCSVCRLNRRRTKPSYPCMTCARQETGQHVPL